MIKYKFGGALNQETRYRSHFDVILKDRSGSPANGAENTDRVRKRSSSRNAKLQQEKTQECARIGAKKTIVLDTSVLVHDPESLDILRNEDGLLVVPWVVLEELDQLKKQTQYRLGRERSNKEN